MKQPTTLPSSLSDFEHKTLDVLGEFKQRVVHFEETVRSNREKIPPSSIDGIQSVFRELLFKLESACRKSPLEKDPMKEFTRYTKQELLPYLMLSNNARRWYEKPKGYPGDYLTLKKLYHRDTGGTGILGPVLDETLLDLPPVQSVRNRRHCLREEICDVIEDGRQKPVSITSLACGAAIEVFDVLQDLENDHTVRFNLLDMDQEAIHHVENRADSEDFQNRIQTFRRNLIFLVKGRHELDLPPQDLIYSSGLIDYFEEDFVLEILNWIYEKLAQGGRAILGNFHPRNPNRAFMDHILEWKLIYRTTEDLKRITKASKFDQAHPSIQREQNGINLFVVCRKN